MSIEEFYKKYKGKYSINLIEKWLNLGYIRGAYIEPKSKLWYIPKEALPPYTRHGNAKGMGIYRSIMKGIINRFDVFGELYGISDLKFNIYIRQLEENGFLETYESEGITYCTTTIKSESFLKMSDSKIFKIFDKVTETALTSVVEKVVNNIVKV